MKNIAALFLPLLFFTFTSFSQDEHQLLEIDSSVPELYAFHKVVYPMWHKAFPEKDYALFKELLPDVNTGAEKIYEAKLPGILRDKQEQWSEGISKLQESIQRYNKACEENNEPEMLASAEVLHTNFEMLVRLIKPVTKEVDEFHKVLYMIYHHYGPEKNTAELNNAFDQLLLRAADLKNSEPPKWAADKKADFTLLVEDLYTSTEELSKLKNSTNELVQEQIEVVHSNYQSLEALFD
jgi:hypothetical protein